MITPNLKNWKYSKDLEMVLFSVQRIEEMLFDHTIDSYKVSVLNAHSLCRELLEVMEEINNGFILPGALNPIIEEFIFSLETDYVSKTILKNKHNEFLKSLKNIPKLTKKNYYELNNKIESEAHTLNIIFEFNYLKTSKNLMKELIKTNKKAELNNVLNSFISELVNKGYSKQYIYQKNRQFFFGTKKEISDVTFLKFLDFFDSKELKFRIIFKVDKGFIQLKEIVEKELNKVKISPNVPDIIPKRKYVESFFKDDPEYPNYITIEEIKQLDYYQARHLGEFLLNIISDVASYNYHKSRLSWDRKALCITEDNHQFIVEPPLPLISKINDHDNLEEAFRNGLNLVKKGFHLENSLNLHSCSLESNTPEIQLMNLWTSIETLLPPPKENLSIRILNFTGNVVPILGRNYVKKLIQSLLDNLKINLSKQEYENLKLLFPKNLSDFEICSQLVSIKENCEPMRDELYKYLLKNPLLKYRVFSLMNQLNNTNSIHETIENHNKRINWHLQRIYRARNMITHKGNKVNNISSLLENMYQYYYTVIDSLFDTTKKNNLEFSSFNATFNIIQKEHDSHLDLLKAKKDVKCDKDNYYLFLFGEEKLD